MGIEYLNNHGDLDFHSLRHSFATYLTINGVHLKVVQDLVRHSDANLTAKRYTDASKIQYTSILKELPETNLTENLTDLTDFSSLEESFVDRKFLRTPLPQDIDNKEDSLNQSEPDVVGVIVKDGGRYWNRTSDLEIISFYFLKCHLKMLKCRTAILVQFSKVSRSSDKAFDDGDMFVVIESDPGKEFDDAFVISFIEVFHNGFDVFLVEFCREHFLESDTTIDLPGIPSNRLC